MFNPERGIKEVIFEILKQDGKSISALSRELKEHGYSTHRLILTGYLRALTDLNILREKDVPPAKLYVPVKGKDQDFYEIVGKTARDIAPPEMADELILFALSRICRRPIFHEELKKAGIQDLPPNIKASNEDRLEAKRVLQRSGFKVPDSQFAYLPLSETNDLFYDLVLSMLINSYGVGFLVRETKQTKLL